MMEATPPSLTTPKPPDVLSSVHLLLCPVRRRRCAAGLGPGRRLTSGETLLTQGLKGLWLGVALALALALLDALWNFSHQKVVAILARASTAVVIGGMAGLLGGLLSGALYSRWPLGAFRVLGYTLVGLLIGLSVGVFDLLANLAANRDPHGALRKVVNGLIGGTLGGVLGGFVAQRCAAPGGECSTTSRPISYGAPAPPPSSLWGCASA